MLRPSLAALCAVCSLSAPAQMSNARLDSLLRVHADTLAGEVGVWQLLIDETQMFCITDPVNDRMRVISPVREAEGLTKAELGTCLAANFHSALDVRYALSEGVLWVAFIHPLASLTDGQFVDGLAQVRSAVRTYGTTYSSTGLVFPLRETGVDTAVADSAGRGAERL